jgi:hypothetical protein
MTPRRRNSAAQPEKTIGGGAFAPGLPLKGFARTKRLTRAGPECALCTQPRLADDPAGLCPAHRERLDAVVATARRYRAERLARWAAP